MPKKLTKSEMTSMCRAFLRGRPTAHRTGELVDGNFREIWLPRLAGHYVRCTENRHTTQADAVKEAQQFKEKCRQWLADRGLPEKEKRTA